MTKKKTNTASKKVAKIGKKFTPYTQDDVRLDNFRKFVGEEDAETIQNGLASALGLPNELQGAGYQGYGVQLSQVDTLFKNNRWYLVSNYRQLLSASYVEHGLIRTIVDLPVDDGLRGGIVIHTRQLDTEEVSDLQAKIEQEKDLTTIAQAMKWDRLFGGAGIVILNGDKPDQPFNAKELKQGSEFEIFDVDMWELNTDVNNVTAENPFIRLNDYGYFSLYGETVDKSRVMLFKGIKPPSFIRPRLRGWGLSVVEALIRSINQYLKSNNLAFEVLDEFKLDIFKIDGLTDMLLGGASGEDAITRRVALANKQKSYQNALTMDAKDDFLNKQLSFTGLAEMSKEIRMQVASDMRMPITKIFGVSATGFNSGEDDIENYNAMIESDIRTPAKANITKIVKLRCMQMFGHVPSDLRIEFKPLRIMSSEQEENVKTQKFSRVLQARQAKEITTEEFRDACNTADLLPVKLDPSEILVLEEEAEEAASQLLAGQVGGQGEEGDDEDVDGSKGGNPSKLKAKVPKATKPTKSARNGILETIRKRIE